MQTKDIVIIIAGAVFLIIIGIIGSSIYHSVRTGELRKNYTEQAKIIRQIRDLENKLGTTIERIPDLVEQSKKEISRLRENYKRSIEQNREFIKQLVKNYNGITSRTRELAEITNAIRTENKRAEEIIEQVKDRGEE